MRKLVTVYAPIDASTRWAYPTREAAQRALSASLPRLPETTPIWQTEFAVPDDAFWTGDLVSVELFRGGYDDEDGIHHGGGWQEPVVGIASVQLIDLEHSEVDGFIADPDTGQHIQSLPLKAGRVGYPYRNAKLVKAND